MIVAGDPDELSVGTGFCFASTANLSYFLTNHHVVGNNASVRVVSPGGEDKSYDGVVIGVGTGKADLAIVVVREGNVPSVRLANAPPIEGENVAVAGYPAIQMRLAGAGLGLSPSMHLGTVNALAGDGYYVEYDAQTDHGNSGGPLYNVDTGDVHAVVTYGIESDLSQAVQNNLAIEIGAAKPLIRSAKAISESSVAALFSSTHDETASPVLTDFGRDTAARFRIDECGAIVDTKTALRWQVSAQNLNWVEARAWTTNLALCDGKAWRMPSIRGALKSIRPRAEFGHWL